MYRVFRLLLLRKHNHQMAGHVVSCTIRSVDQRHGIGRHVPGERKFAFAWNMPTNTVPLVYAANGAGNDVTRHLVVVFPKKEQPKYTVHDLQVSDAFMQ